MLTAYRDCNEQGQTIHFMIPYFGCEGIMLNDMLLLIVKAFNRATNQIHDSFGCITDTVLWHFKAHNVKFMMHTPQGTTSARDTLRRLVTLLPGMSNVRAEVRTPAEGIDAASYMFMADYSRFPRRSQDDFDQAPTAIQKKMSMQH